MMCWCVCVWKAIHSVAWHHEGKQFVCSHSDGTLTTWNVRAPAKAAQIITPHGRSSLYRIRTVASFTYTKRVVGVACTEADGCQRRVHMCTCTPYLMFICTLKEKKTNILFCHLILQQGSSLRMEKSQNHASLSWKWSTKQQGLGKCDAGKSTPILCLNRLAFGSVSCTESGLSCYSACIRQARRAGSILRSRRMASGLITVMLSQDLLFSVTLRVGWLRCDHRWRGRYAKVIK